MLRSPSNMPAQPESVICSGAVPPLWMQRDQEHSRHYYGIFVLFGPRGFIATRMTGRVVEWDGLPVDVYIFDPPLALRSHPHGRCLQLMKPGSRWYKLHWEKPAKTFDEARAYVEGLMADCLPH